MEGKKTMKALIVYYSFYRNNTEKIARIFAGKLAADLVNLKDSYDIKAGEYDVIGFGSGVYRESVSPRLNDAIRKLDLKDKRVFVFTTSGVGMRYYNKRTISLLKSRGAICKGSFSCKGSFTSREFSSNKIFEAMSRFSTGHPDKKDIKKAESFIEKLEL